MLQPAISPRLARAWELSLPWFVLIAVLAYTLGMLFALPYAGFEFRGATGEVTFVFPERPEPTLKPGDKLLQIGDLSWSDFDQDFQKELFGGLSPGTTVPILIERDGQQVTLPWVLPGWSTAEFRFRLESEWVLAYVFWLAGLLTFLLLRPRDERWWLLTAFNFLTALWLAGGSVASHWHLWSSPLVFRSAIWLTVPVLLHLHWVFPQSLRPLPRAGWWVAYGTALFLAVAEWFRVVPEQLHLAGFGLAAVTSVLLMVYRVIFRPEQRRALGILGAVVLAALLPALAITVARFFSSTPVTGASLLVLPALPLGYLVAAQRRRFTGLELRANRLLSLYFFLVCLAVGLILVLAILDTRVPLTSTTYLTALGTAVIATVATVAGFNRFQELVERYVLGIPYNQAKLSQRLRELIISRLDMSGLQHALRHDVLPSLVIREAALVQFDDAGRMEFLLVESVAQADLPSEADLAELQTEAGMFRAPDASQRCPWVRLVLPLMFDQKAIGIWLLGRHDPDDMYGKAEIEVLQTIADYVAIALTHIRQTERLRAFFKTDVSRHELERTKLAHELHDNVLNSLMALTMGAETLPPDTQEAINNVVKRLRHTMSDLRLPVMQYGLATAVEALVDELVNRVAGAVTILTDINSDDSLYPAEVMQQIFRIVQQAAENALSHANPKTVDITGRLDADLIDLTVADDGIGFETGQQLNLSHLLEHKHFGLVGVIERAALVGAEVRIESAPGAGTRLHVTWRPALPA